MLYPRQPSPTFHVPSLALLAAEKFLHLVVHLEISD